MWKIIQSCTVGEQHIAAHRPCQDRCLAAQSGDRLILAVADGHGGTFYCRSQVGAALACEAAIDILGCPEISWEDAAACIKTLFDCKVRVHLRETPLTDQELILVNGQPDEIAYGTTLICCCITPEGIYRAQIGDGDMYALTFSGALLPQLEEDENCIGFFTSSLISQNAVQKFRWRYDPEPAAVVALYTDGYVPRTSRPWKLLDLAQFLPEELPQEILDAGQRGDDQTVLLAFHTGAVETQNFRKGYSEEQARHLLEERQTALLRQIYETDSTIKIFIDRLARCEDIRLRNRLIGLLTGKQEKFLALCEEYQAMEDKLTGKETSPEDPGIGSDTSDPA